MTNSPPIRGGLRIVGFSLDHPWIISALVLLAVAAAGVQVPKIRVDTDPENMLSETEAVRVFHNRVKKRFTLNDILVLGIVNEKHPDGVFNPDTLAKVFRITEAIQRIDGVITQDIISPSTTDNIRQAGPGTVRFEWLMAAPPKNRAGALDIRSEARDNPLLDGTLVSGDGRALALYVPLREKRLSYRVASRIREVVAGLPGDEKYYITGLPVAEDTFGVEMFRQMAVSAPLAGLIIFLLMWLFFRKAVLVVSPMLVAVATIVVTMGALIGAGFTVHIMSSMIPIFLMPIAVVDSVHILSVFFDKYPSVRDRRETMLRSMGELFRPMLFTSLTSAAGFASLALTPIPPVRVFGLFVAFGIMLAWVLTVTFVPAYAMFIREASLENLGASGAKAEAEGTLLGRLLAGMGAFTYRRPWPILGSAVFLLALAAWGVTRIEVNDNPVKWFTKRHPIRVADDVLNRHFGGTYMAYLVLEERPGREGLARAVSGIRKRLRSEAEALRGDVPALPGVAAEAAELLQRLATRRLATRPAREGGFGLVPLLSEAIAQAEGRADAAAGDRAEAWEEVLDILERERNRAQTFKQPDVLRYVAGLQEAMRSTGVVGKSNSLADLVKKVHYELREGDRRYNV
ncbi:MAG: MMPL family transporter, partial [Nitrospinota bacterium]